MTAPTTERIQALDVLRGVAVGGILVANVLVFFGLFILPPERAAALATARIDAIAAFLEKTFVDGKFYSLFSLLFGIGFGLQIARGAAATVPRFRRRLRILLAIGAVHAFLIWAGDILMLYALLGFTLPWFARRTDRELLRWVVVLLAIPTALYLAALAVWRPAPSGDGGGGGMPASILASFEAMGRGNLKDALKGNLLFVAIRWADLFATVRFPKVLGMFVLGLWAVRAGVAQSPREHRSLLERWRWWGWVIGLPANIIAALALHRWPYLPPSPGGLLGVVMQAIGVPMLAIGYAATVGLLADRPARGRRVIDLFAPVGRMALTNYLLQSLICVVLSYGFGFGLWWRVGAAPAIAVALGILLLQIPLSAWWLARYRFGPVEWVWRRLTYRQPLRMREAV